MHFRRFFAIFTLILVGGIVVACGSEDEADDPTPTVEVATDPTATTETSPTATVEAASPDASPVASPHVSPVASPVSDAAVIDEEADEADSAPEIESTPETSGDTEVVPLPVDSDEDTAAATATEVPLQSLTGTLTLDGREQVDYTVTEEGCVGLGTWRQLKPGTQVIVRDASGTVVDIAELEAATEGDGCSWSFALDAPASDFFSVSISMVTEVWFDQDDAGVQAGEIELFVP